MRLIEHCRRDFVDPETKAQVSAAAARAEAQAARVARRETARKLKASKIAKEKQVVNESGPESHELAIELEAEPR